MKVTAKTHDHLTVESKPWITTGIAWLFGLAALLAVFTDDSMGIAERLLVLALGVGTIALAWWLMPFTSLDLDRPEGTLVVTHARVTGATQIEYALGDIESTLVQYDQTDGADLERLVLKTDTGIKPVEFGYSAKSRKAVMEEINSWLKMEMGA